MSPATRLFWLGVFALVLVKCTHTQAVVGSGEALDQLGDEFIAGAAALATAHEQGRVSDETYHRWQVFGEKFKATYHLAVQLWIAAADSRDADMTTQVGNIIAALGQEMAQFLTEVRNAPQPAH